MGKPKFKLNRKMRKRKQVHTIHKASIYNTPKGKQVIIHKGRIMACQQQEVETSTYIHGQRLRTVRKVGETELAGNSYIMEKWLFVWEVAMIMTNTLVCFHLCLPGKHMREMLLTLCWYVAA